ncbi:F0F1 ATP synthase subunit gamma, partial [Streptococcus suis]
MRVHPMIRVEDFDHNEADGYTATFELEPTREGILEQLWTQSAAAPLDGALLAAAAAANAGGWSA